MGSSSRATPRSRAPSRPLLPWVVSRSSSVLCRGSKFIAAPECSLMRSSSPHKYFFQFSARPPAHGEVVARTALDRSRLATRRRKSRLHDLFVGSVARRRQQKASTTASRSCCCVRSATPTQRRAPAAHRSCRFFDTACYFAGPGPVMEVFLSCPAPCREPQRRAPSPYGRPLARRVPPHGLFWFLGASGNRPASEIHSDKWGTLVGSDFSPSPPT